MSKGMDAHERTDSGTRLALQMRSPLVGSLETPYGYLSHWCFGPKDSEWGKCCLNFGLTRKLSKAPPCFAQSVRGHEEVQTFVTSG
jgi:hypothetical protein